MCSSKTLRVRGTWVSVQLFPLSPLKHLTATVFETYNLISALGLTSGGLSVAAATYQTAGGTLDFDSITALSFEATGGVPELSTWAMMLAGFAGLGFLGYRQTVKAHVAA